jgi:hypothetical protein
MMRTPFVLAGLGVALTLSACTTLPDGPSVMALPGSGKSLAMFQDDDAACRDYALTAIGGKTPQQAATGSGVKSAVVGTAIGAAAGAALGGQSGAGVGAGAGLLVGSAAGSGAAESSGHNLQQRYDTRYIQCMYARGNRVPVYGNFSQQPRNIAPPPGVPRPPAGSPPPPPPDAPAP